MNQLASSHTGGPLLPNPLGQAKPTNLSPTEPAQAVPSAEVWSHLNLQQQAQVNRYCPSQCEIIPAPGGRGLLDKQPSD